MWRENGRTATPGSGDRPQRRATSFLSSDALSLRRLQRKIYLDAPAPENHSVITHRRCSIESAIVQNGARFAITLPKPIQSKRGEKMARTVQAVWPAATVSPLRDGKIHSPKWSPRTHHGRNASDSIQRPSAIPRTFAEFPFSRSWQEIFDHAKRLEGASLVQEFGQGDETWIRFVYMGQWFGVQDGGHRLTLTVDDSGCRDAILVAVNQHFDPLLSRHLRD